MKFVVNSAYRDDAADSPANYTWSSGTATPYNTSSMSLEHVCVPKPRNIVTGINAASNFAWTDPGPTAVSVNVAIPPGYYDGPSLAAVIHAQLNAVSTTIMVSFDPATGHLVLSTASVSAVPVTVTAPNLETALTLGVNQSTLTSDVTPTAAVAASFPSAVDLSWPSYLLLRISVNQTGSAGNTQTDRNRYTFVVPMKQYTAGSIVDMYSLGTLKQFEQLQNLRPETLRISWQWPELPAISVTEADLFDGLNHIIVLELD